MIVVLVVLAAIMAIAATLARWTRFNPLMIAALGGLPGGLIALLLDGGTLGRQAWGFTAIIYVVTTAASALGAFAGWLRRTNLERRM